MSTKCHKINFLFKFIIYIIFFKHFCLFIFNYKFIMYFYVISSTVNVLYVRVNCFFYTFLYTISLYFAHFYLVFIVLKYKFDVLFHMILNHFLKLYNKREKAVTWVFTRSSTFGRSMIKMIFN